MDLKETKKHVNERRKSTAPGLYAVHVTQFTQYSMASNHGPEKKEKSTQAG